MQGPKPDITPAPSYKPEYAVRARELCARGAGESDLAAAFQVSVWAIKLWRTTHDEFRKAIILGHETADDRVTMALYERCVGYTYDAVKPMVVSLGKDGSEIQEYNYKEHVPPDTAGCRYWLNNRRPDIWRERVEQVNTNRDDVKQLTDEELTKIIRAGGSSGAGDASAPGSAPKSDKLH